MLSAYRMCLLILHFDSLDSWPLYFLLLCRSLFTLYICLVVVTVANVIWHTSLLLCWCEYCSTIIINYFLFCIITIFVSCTAFYMFFTLCRLILDITFNYLQIIFFIIVLVLLFLYVLCRLQLLVLQLIRLLYRLNTFRANYWQDSITLHIIRK